MKINFAANILEWLLFYMFGVLYIQIWELFLPFSITKLVFMILILAIVYGFCKRKIRGDIFLLPVLLAGGIYIVIYITSMRGIFSYVYPPIATAVMALLLLDNFARDLNSVSWKKADKLIFFYLILNVVLYLFKWESCFQYAGSTLQFKGALPHTNMLGAVLLSLYLMSFWEEGKLSWINRGLVFFLILVTYSRTYIAAILLVIIVQILNVSLKKIPFAIKFVWCFVMGVGAGLQLFLLLADYIPVLARFKTFGFTGNGRQYLEAAYKKTIRESDLTDLIFGIKMPRPYLRNIKMDFAHSFTENSYAGIFLLFGAAGCAVFAVILIRMLRQIRSLQALCLLAVCLITLTIQDTLLSVQTGIILVFSTGIVIFKDPGRKKGGGIRWKLK